MATAGARARWRERRHACALGGAETSTRRQRGRQVSGGGPGPGRGGAGRLSVSPFVRSSVRPSVRAKPGGVLRSLMGAEAAVPRVTLRLAGTPRGRRALVFRGPLRR